MQRKLTLCTIALTLCLTLNGCLSLTTSTAAIDTSELTHQREVVTPDNKAALKNELDDLCLHKQTTPHNIALQKKWCGEAP